MSDVATCGTADQYDGKDWRFQTIKEQKRVVIGNGDSLCTATYLLPKNRFPARRLTNNSTTNFKSTSRMT